MTVLFSLAATLSTATFYESLNGTKPTQVFIYRSWWFLLILLFLGVNIFCSAAQRYPWKKHQAGFVVAHLGILTVLYGSLLTKQFGIDGNMPLYVGETSSTVSIDEPQFEIWNQTKNIWLVKKAIEPLKIKPSSSQPHLETADWKLFFHDVYAKASPQLAFAEDPDKKESPALLIEITSPSMQMNTPQWLKALDPELGHVVMGLAEISFAYETGESVKKGKSNPHQKPDQQKEFNSTNFFKILAKKDGTLRYILSSSKQGQSQGTLVLDKPIDTGWRDFQLTLKKQIPHGRYEPSYIPLPVGPDNNDAPSALKVGLQYNGQEQQQWFGYGESKTIDVGGDKFLVRFGPKLVSVPFALKLNFFEVGKYPGTDRPKTYSSKVQLMDAEKAINHEELITMNEPLQHRSFVFYQASYQQTPQGLVSVLSVGRDPGRTAKYLGSILLVLGIIIMYTYKFFLLKATPQKEV